MLGHTIICRIDLSQVNPISRHDERLKKIEYPAPSFRGEKPFHVFKDKGSWPVFCNNFREAAY